MSTLAVALSVAAITHQVNAGPAHDAARRGDALALRHAIGESERVDERDSSGATPLIIAARYGQPGCIRLLLESDADINA